MAKIYLCIYNGLTFEWEIEELEDCLGWLKRLTQADSCEDAIALAWMKKLTSDEKKKLSLLRDLYVGQFDGRTRPPVDLENLYKSI